VRALSAVEEIHLLLLLRRRGAHIAALGHLLGVHDAGGLAVGADASAMPEADLVVPLGKGSGGKGAGRADEEGAGSREEDVAVAVSADRLVRVSILAYPYSWGTEMLKDMLAVWITIQTPSHCWRHSTIYLPCR